MNRLGDIGHATVAYARRLELRCDGARIAPLGFQRRIHIDTGAQYLLDTGDILHFQRFAAIDAGFTADIQ